MKKLILVLIILNGSFNAGAQVQFGVKAGLNIANFKTSGITYVNGTSLNSRTNFNAGVIASIPLFSNSFLQPELCYSGQGQAGAPADIFCRFGDLND